jgi:hypothetical protein
MLKTFQVNLADSNSFPFCLRLPYSAVYSLGSMFFTDCPTKLVSLGGPITIAPTKQKPQPPQQLQQPSTKDTSLQPNYCRPKHFLDTSIGQP